MPIYTRTGDKGDTSLFGGKRVSKNNPLVELYGSVDELNSWIGLVQAELKDPRLSVIQRELLTIGSSLAGWDGDISFISERVSEMEQWIDEMEKETGKLHNFILPGGSVLGARIHLVRTVARKVERLAVGAHAKPEIIKYFNRLSDLFFGLARFINKKQNIQEEIWSGIGPKKK